MSELVQRLCTGEHPVEVVLRPQKTATALQECIGRGFVHIKFTNTRGGTELGVRIDKDRSDFAAADFSTQTGRVKFVGGLTLDYVKVRCVADINLETFNGTGHLEPVEF